ncbi:MAG: ParB/RepB/Spo0J family partition protein [Acidobacteriota bacterium]
MSSADDKPRRLGKGLSALLPNRPAAVPPAVVIPAPDVAPLPNVAPVVQEKPSRLPVASIEPNPKQPRDVFAPERLEELAASIRAHGIIQPIVVRKGGKGYQIIAGERRWRAAQLAGLSDVPVVIQEVTDKDLLEIALIENIQREDLNPIETARAFEKLSHELGLSQEEIGHRTGKDRATISNLIRLLRLPQEVQQLVVEGKISMGHARAILGLHSPDDQVALARKAATHGMSVRQVEVQVQVLMGDRPSSKKAEKPQDPNVKAAIEALEHALGTRVKIVQSGDEKGRIEIEYYSQAELDRLYYLLAGEER